MLIDAIIAQVRCRKFLAGDGITTVEFTVSAFPGAFEGLSIDARVAKKSSPAFGEAFSVAKNLDEYQYRICSLVPSLTDSPAKILLQKYRIAIGAAFAKLVSVLRYDQSILRAWTGHARLLLEEVSDAYVAYGSPRAHGPRIGEALAFFGLTEANVDSSLAVAYGQ